MPRFEPELQPEEDELQVLRPPLSASLRTADVIGRARELHIVGVGAEVELVVLRRTRCVRNAYVCWGEGLVFELCIAVRTGCTRRTVQYNGLRATVVEHIPQTGQYTAMLPGGDPSIRHAHERAA